MKPMRAEEDRATIRLSLGSDTSPSESAPIVRLEVDRGGEMVGHVGLPLESLGLAADFDPSHYSYGEPTFAIDEQLWATIRGPVEVARAEGQPLWLQLCPPVGNLAVLPWERMLAPILKQLPIVRLPSFSLFVPLGVERVDIVLCLSEPTAKSPFDGAGFVRRLIESLLAVTSTATFVHLFTDADTYRELRRWGHDRRVILHDPHKAPPSHRATVNEPDPDPRDGVTNPWLLWIIDEMRESTAEIVHFVTHGYLARGGQSALALADSPARNDDEVTSGLVGPNQLAACLAQLGAWGVGFTSPPGNYSAMGLRQLFNDVEPLRVGPVVHHDADFDRRGEQLARTYARLVEGGPPTPSSAISAYLHPALFMPEHEAPLIDPVATVLASLSHEGVRPTDAPAWATSTKRYLGQAAARRLPASDEADSTIEQANARGIEDVLRWVNEVVEQVQGEER